MRLEMSPSSWLAGIGVSLLLLGGIGGGVPDHETKDGMDLFFRDSNVESVAAQEWAHYPGADPGDAKTFARSFPDAPPQIPHSVEDLLPITLDSNACLDCHEPGSAREPGEVPIPQTHFRYPVMGEAKASDPMRWVVKGYVQREQLSGARYNCTTCHTPQSDNARVAGSTFEPVAGEPTQ